MRGVGWDGQENAPTEFKRYSIYLVHLAFQNSKLFGTHED